MSCIFVRVNRQFPTMSETAVKKEHETNVKETIESIVVAFILAFIFRCFVVEAFVIPTGSMAPTLMGAYMAYDCPDCGFHFNVGFPSISSDSMFVPQRASNTGPNGGLLSYSILCPQCGYRMQSNTKLDESGDPVGSAVRYGDRILVMKYAYLINDPARWDVVVFKTPDTRNGSDYSTNYIKRLIGRPGESLFIAQGDVYVCPPTIDGKKTDPNNIDDYVIQTKPRAAQDALWRTVYDADYVPQNLPRMVASDGNWQFPWRVVDGAGWSLPTTHGKGTVFTYNGTERSTVGFDEKVTPQKGALTDWLAFDQSYGQNDQPLPRSLNPLTVPSYAQFGGRFVWPVSDLKLAAYVDQLEGEGNVSLRLTKGDDQFVAELSTAGIRLLMTRNGKDPQVLGTSPMVLGKKPARVELQNVDYRVAILVDGKEVLASTPAQYRPDLKKIRQEVDDKQPGPRGGAMISAAGVKTQLSHVQLWRDVYYIDMDVRGDVVRATAHNFPSNVVKLGKGEFFVMGDNSFASYDARMWRSSVHLKHEGVDAEAGIVPEHFMLGRAFFVYWPAGFRPGANIPPIIPNFGQMRFIH